MSTTVQFDGEACTVVIGAYAAPSNTAITLVSAEDSTPMARLTVNLDGIPAGMIAVDANNLGSHIGATYRILRTLGYRPTPLSLRSGYCQYPLWEKTHEC